MKYFSTFSGIGGFELGIGEKADCIGFSEIDKYAIQIYQKHFDHKNYGDITKISTDALPDFDLLCGGFPCQSFSIAGKRGGFDDTRGTLFFELARIARSKRPRLLFFENVKGLLSHDGGRTFDTIIRTINELGYDCQWQVLNSKNFGVPQNRERVFIIGHLRGTARPQVFPIQKNNSADIVLPTLTTRYYGGQANGGYIGNKQEQRIIQKTGNNVKDESYREIENVGAIKSSNQSNPRSGGTSLVVVPLKFLDRNQKNYQGEYSFTVDTLNSGGIMEGVRIRRLTPIECERLQGFPDGWTEGISDSQRYKCLGNAVTVNVIKYLANKFLTTK